MPSRPSRDRARIRHAEFFPTINGTNRTNSPPARATRILSALCQVTLATLCCLDPIQAGGPHLAAHRTLWSGPPPIPTTGKIERMRSVRRLVTCVTPRSVPDRRGIRQGRSAYRRTQGEGAWASLTPVSTFDIWQFARVECVCQMSAAIGNMRTSSSLSSAAADIGMESDSDLGVRAGRSHDRDSQQNGSGHEWVARGPSYCISHFLGSSGNRVGDFEGS